MRETGYGWNIEMQMKAARAGLRVLELPVPYRRRAGGNSKVAGSLRGSVRAGWRIIITIVRIAVCRREKGVTPTEKEPTGRQCGVFSIRPRR